MPGTEVNKPTPKLTAIDAIIASLLGLGGLLLYVRTLAPTLLRGDSAEFQTLAKTLGMTHPTGYPVYLLVAKVFTWLPVANIAYRVNLLSAVCAAITLVLVFLIGRILTGSRIAALVGPFVLGLAGIFWSQAVIAEIYTPAAMLLAGVLLCLFIWRQGDNPRYLFLAGLLGGLSLGVHNTVSLAAPAIFVYLLLTTRRRTDWLNAIAGSGLGIALFLAAFFWIDSRLVPTSYFNTVVRTSLSGWGLSPQDLNTPLKRLSFLFGARQFRGQMFGAPLGVIGLNIQRYWHALRADFSIFALGLIALGVLSPFTRKRQVMDWREALLILLCLLFILGFVFNYHIGDIHVFYIPSYVILGIVCSLGAALFLDLLAWPSRQDSLGGTKWSLFFASIYGLLILFLVVWPMRDVTYQSWQAGHLLTTRHRIPSLQPRVTSHSDANHHRITRIANEFESDAIVFTDWGSLYAYYYVSHLERGHIGMRFHETRPAGTGGRFSQTALDYIQANIDQHPIYVDGRLPELRDRYIFQPVGDGFFRLWKR